MNKPRHASLWRKSLLLLIDSIVVGLLGYALLLFLDYWWDYMSSALDNTAKEVWLSWDALNPWAYAHLGYQAMLSFVCLLIAYLSLPWRRHLWTARTRPDPSANVPKPEAPVSGAKMHTTTNPRLRRVAGIINIVGGSLGLLMALPAWIAAPLANSSLNQSAALLFAVSGLVAIVGGIIALQGKNWLMAFAGAIGTTAIVSLLGLTAVIPIILGRDGHERQQQDSRVSSGHHPASQS